MKDSILGRGVGVVALVPHPVTLTVSLAGLVVLLLVGQVIGSWLGLRRWGLPEALLSGLLGLAVAPAGWLPLVPAEVMDIWGELPTILLTLVFATLLLGRPLPKVAGLWQPVSGQILLALTLGFGQYMVGGLAVLLLLGPWLGVHPLMACLIEVGYEGGHGSAAAMGPTFARLGFSSGEPLGLAMATVGLLAATLVGGALVVIGRLRGWASHSDAPSIEVVVAAVTASAGPLAATVAHPVMESATVDAPALWRVGSDWALNLALAGSAVAVGVVFHALLQLGADGVGGALATVIDAFPVFPLALAGSLLVRWILERTGRAHWASTPILSLTGTVASDLLIAAATACLDLSLLRHDWLPLSVLAAGGLLWNLLVVLWLAPRILPADWFERALIEFGQATGVAASGLLLLRMADPQDRSTALQAFSIKQLLLQPILAGGVVTVVAPLVVDSLGLTIWTGICLAMVVVASGLGLVLASRADASGALGVGAGGVV